ncbi:MAG: geranylgeranyl reductase family protein [Nitrospirae bacterium]|nr:geranylgeranyl reductase family protein [Nitrospirota bacterium]
MKLRTKVLVVGGGPAGATAARFLAEGGVDVILLERDSSFVKPCGGGVPSSAFDEFSIPKSVVKKEVKSIKIVSPMGERLDIEFKGVYLAIVERGEFDNALREMAEKSGARLIEGEFVRFIDDKPYKVEANVGEVKAEIVSEYVIAADGVNSRVRTALSIKPTCTLFTISERIKGVKTGVCEFWFGSSHAPCFYSWVFPKSDGISAGTGGSEPKEIRTLLEKFKERSGITSDGVVKIYRIPVWKGDLFNKGKILFVGDCAGQVMPLSHEGIYYAMKSGEYAARAIIEEKADNYKRVWKARFQKRFALMDKLRDYFLKDDISAERLVALHRRPEVQEASMRLWLRKDSSKEGLLSYMRLFGKFLS